MSLLESAYGNFLRVSFAMINPLKKSVIKTQCQVHKFINAVALNILKNDGYIKEYSLFNEYLNSINEGAVWADQDFRSTGHFYNPYTKKGLYGRRNALDLSVKYYNNALNLWNINEKNKAMFYFGAALHILQDMVIPQHANVRLLDNHKQYETFVKKTYKYVQEFKVESGAYVLDSLEEYIKLNARTAMKLYKKFQIIEDDEQRFYRTTRCILPLAERTSAGCMVTFYRKIIPEDKISRYVIYGNIKNKNHS